MPTKTTLPHTMFNVRSYSLISDQIEYPELQVIIRELGRVLTQGTTGDIVELGCYEGTTSLFIQRVLQAQKSSQSFHVYDSFSGLPPKTSADSSPAGEQFQGGELVASKARMIRHFRQAGLKLPVIHKAWFEDLTTNDMPEKIAFAFLDGDFYTSIASSLAVITPLLADDATIVVDDYQSEALPGASRAVDEWAKQHGQTVRSEQSLGIIHYSA